MHSYVCVNSDEPMPKSKFRVEPAVAPAVIPFPPDDAVWTPEDVAAFLKLATLCGV